MSAEASRSEIGAESQLAERLRALRRSREYTVYETVRREVLRAKAREAEATAKDPSAYWREELETVDYLLDASPLVIAKLRRHCHHVTGVRVYDYRSGKGRSAGRFAEKLDALVELGGPDLLVPESPALGGFGFEIDGALYNLDTLKFYEALIALDRGEVLEMFRHRTDERRVVLEIGAGWGGFAYQFKSLFPSTTYVVVDLPELFLFSAVYLAAVIPDATMCFWDPTSAGPPNVTDYDFVFVPYSEYDSVRLPRLDLAMNMVSFQEMTTEQVRGYVRWVHEQGSRFLYSLNRDRSPYNDELLSVHGLIEERFWLHEIEVLPVSYVKMLDSVKPRDPKKSNASPRDAERDRLDYRHVVGWRRTDVG